MMTRSANSASWISRVYRLAVASGMLALLSLGLVLTMFSLFGGKPDNLGVSDGRFAACPNTPNCVSTQARDAEHAVEPIPYTGSADTALEQLHQVLSDLPRTRILTQHGRYIHAESRSLIFRFVDDVEFYVDAGQKIIHVRSASRVGHSDLGVNRERVEAIRKAIAQLGEPRQELPGQKS